MDQTGQYSGTNAPARATAQAWLIAAKSWTSRNQIVAINRRGLFVST